MILCLDRVACLPWRLSYVPPNRAGGWRAWQVEFSPSRSPCLPPQQEMDNILRVIIGSMSYPECLFSNFLTVNSALYARSYLQRMVLVDSKREWFAFESNKDEVGILSSS